MMARMRARWIFTALLVLGTCALALMLASTLSSLTIRHMEKDYETVGSWDISRNGVLVAQDVSGLWTEDGDVDFSSTWEIRFDLKDVDGDYRDPALCFRSYGSSVLLYKDDALVWAYTASEKGYRPPSFDGGRYALIHLGNGWKDADYRIVMVTTYAHDPHSFHPILVGERLSLMIHQVGTNLPSLLVACSILFIAFLLLIGCLLFENRTAKGNMLSILLLYLATGLWIITQNRSKQFIVGNVTMALDLSWFVMAVIPSVMLNYLRRNYHMELPLARLFDWMATLMVILEVIMCTAYVFFHQCIDPLLNLMTALMIVFFIALSAAMAISWMRSHFEGGLAATLGLLLYLLSISMEGVFLSSPDTISNIQVMLYLPLYIGLMVFLLRAVKESMSSSRTNDERRRAMHLVFTDPMTGLLNRRALANRLSHIGKAGMDGDLHIIMFDIDGMKDCNDRFGHVMGDKLIQSFAESLKQASADLDKYIFRYGGDEFLMIVYENGPFDSDKVIASVRDCFAQLTPTGKSGFSAGYSRLDAATREDLEVKLREADTRMYYEKMRRRSKEGTHQ